MLDDLTRRVSRLVRDRDALGFNVKFSLGDDGVIYVDGERKPMTVGNTDSDADTTFRISAEDLDALLRGELNAMNAYMQGRLVVDGDLTKALQLSNLFG